MPFGLSESVISDIRSVFARHPAVEKAILYGSRAKGTFKPGSDIDLTLCGDGLTATQLALIEDSLEELGLPYAIDLSAHDGLTHPELRGHIERVGVEFYRRQPG